MKNNDIVKQNKLSWDKKVKNNNPWSIPVTKEEIDNAKNGIFNIKLTPKKYVPEDWFPKNLKNKKILCLASGGGKQVPILAACGAIVTVYDISHNQLKQDEKIAKQNSLMISTVQGNMTNLEFFKDDYFDMIFCPVSVTYIPDVAPVFKECYRVLKSGGKFLFGSVNPLVYLFNNKKSDDSIEYSHTLEDLIGGQTSVGFIIKGFYEDSYEDKICNYTPKYFATKAEK